MFVVERGEGDGREPSALQPVHHSSVDGHSLFRSDIGTILGRGGAEGAGGGAEGEGQGNGQEGRDGRGVKEGVVGVKRAEAAGKRQREHCFKLRAYVDQKQTMN